MTMIEYQSYQIKIIHEDEDYIVLDKPSGLLVHPYPQKTKEKTCLLKIVRDYLGAYVYPVHRLDRPVSGLIIFGKSSESSKDLQEIWPSVTKKYLALVRGVPESEGEFSFDLRDKNKVPKKSLTLYRRLQAFDRCSLMEVSIKTGRRHQIRRHFSRRMHHVIGDTKYGKGGINNFYRENCGVLRIFLHSSTLEFCHPSTQEVLALHSSLPDDLSVALRKVEELPAFQEPKISLDKMVEI